jgi:hypothetical protein
MNQLGSYKPTERTNRTKNRSCNGLENGLFSKQGKEMGVKSKGVLDSELTCKGEKPYE